MHIFIILIDKLSYLCALVQSNDFIIDMPLSVTLKEVILVFALYEEGGRTRFLLVYILMQSSY